MLESRFKTKLIEELEDLFPGCIIHHFNPNECQGLPDLLILYKRRWAALEGKRNNTSSHRPNQDYWVEVMNNMSFARFIDQDNKEEVLDELQYAFGTKRVACLSRS